MIEGLRFSKILLNKIDSRDAAHDFLYVFVNCLSNLCSL